ncbi:diaminopimelate epimerase [Maribacter sp. 2307ULW6-5]|uniref:diaminopimelate epimerase n=1 Tax=Maribacter sp. 2307ULW6-5 TaxID=3386275 RepID=UPI0039BC50F6
MNMEFYKYQGTGNDFVLMDNRDGTIPKNDNARIAQLCDRRFGIGADGLILLEHDTEVDFSMVYFNSDGRESTMCGNGGRCIVAFAHYLGLIADATTFRAVDGLHNARMDKEGRVHLGMSPVMNIEKKGNALFMDTGSPHHVQAVEDLSALDVAKEGAKIRYGNYGKKGSNINFVQSLGENVYRVRTYERGVEDETLSCGTGVTAVALALSHWGKTTSNAVDIKVEGGSLRVTFEKVDAGYGNITLIGPAQQVFKGQILW